MRNEVPIAIMLDALVRGIFDSGNKLIFDASFVQEMGDLVAQDTTDVLLPEQIVEAIAKPNARLLDFGCGPGNYRSMLEALGYQWTGVNYAEGMGNIALEQARRKEDILFYDGLLLPFADMTFDVVYSFQTFEHIQDIKITFSEIARVLKPGGHLVGAVSYNEQFHDYSTFNFTPYGLKLACSQAGLRLTKVYPKFDVFSWFFRRLLIDTIQNDSNSITDTMSSKNEIGRLFIEYSLKMGLSCREANLLRLLYSSHFSFDVLRER